MDLNMFRTPKWLGPVIAFLTGFGLISIIIAVAIFIHFVFAHIAIVK
jgi:hypothetical protein